VIPGRGAAGPTSPDAVVARLLPAFSGHTAPGWLRRRVAAGSAVGMTLFTFHNTRDAGQIRELVDSLQSQVPGDPPLLVAADQEGGQLVGLGSGSTAFPGSMALGAADDAALTEEVGRATADEMRALGATVCYAPVCDLAEAPGNVSIGTRSFGSEPAAVARHAAALVRGLAAGGVVATPKHFPGKGAVTVDTHFTLGVVDRDREGLLAHELAPFRASFEAGAGMVMSGHFALPGVTGEGELPATLSRRIMSDLLRRELGFSGVSITDALDMKALAQGAGQLVEAISALRAGVDLLLCTPDRAAQRRLEDGLRQAARRGLIPAARTRQSLRRVAALRRWLGRFPRPDMAVVRSEAHLALARRAAAASLTVVRDDPGLLPLRLPAEAALAVVTPTPRDLTPADSSSAEALDLAGEIRRHHARVREVVVAAEPTDDDISAVREALAGCEAAVVGTIATNVQPAQARLVHAVLETGVPTVTVALRTPYDLADYPSAGSHVCAWSIVPAALAALADGLFGQVPMPGRLPVPIPGLYASGHSLTRT
jgi:beta-N-acetylhexosaminidase